MRALVAFGVLVVLAICAVLILGSEERDPPSDAERGRALFVKQFTPEQGLGPLFNERSCAGCHLEPSPGGVGRNGLATAMRVGRLTREGFDPMVGRGGPFARAHAISELGAGCGRAPGIPAGVNVTSVRNAPALFGSGLIDAISEQAITAGAVAKRNGVSGRPNLVRGPDGRKHVGRFGWKADTPTLEQFVAEAFRSELGMTSSPAPAPARPRGENGACAEKSPAAEVDRDELTSVVAFVAGLSPPAPRRSPPGGAAVFRATGCAACHTMALRTGSREVHLYSDLLLHDMGQLLDDRVEQGSARGREWRTAPLWGLRDRARYLHDGRARSLEAAILAHGGEAHSAKQRFRSLSSERRRSLLAFLKSL